MISLTDKEKYIIKKYIVEHDIVYFNVKKFDFSNGTYYIKFCKEDEAFKELLGKKVFDIVGIKCPEYKYYKDLYCVVSEDLNTFGKFTYMSDFPFIVDDTTYRRISFGILVEAVCKYFNNKDDVYYQVVVMHFIDILFSNIDRHLNNYGVFIDENNNGSLAGFDNGLLLDNFDCITKPQSCITEKMFFSKIVECEYFIKKLPLEYRLKLYELYLKFTPSFVKELMEEVDNESGINFKAKKSTLLKYYKNYLLVGMVMNKYISHSDKKEIVMMRKGK